MTGKSNVLSIRVTDDIRERLAIIRNSYSKSLGETLTIKDALFRYLDQVERDGQTSHDVYSLLTRKEQHLRRLREKLDGDESFTHAEWSFLAHLAHDAYFYEPVGRSAYASEYVVNAICAFAAVLAVRNAIGAGSAQRDRLYFGNLMSPGALASDRCASGLLQEAIDYTVGYIDRAPIARVNAASMVSNLLIALRDEDRLPQAELDRALGPYRRSLFVSAARGLHIFQRVNRTMPLTYCRTRGEAVVQEKPFKVTLTTEHHSLELVGDAVDCQGKLGFGRTRTSLKLGFSKLEDLAGVMCHRLKTPDLRFDSDTNRLIDGKVCARFSAEEAADLTELFAAYLSDDRIQPQRALGQLTWGAI